MFRMSCGHWLHLNRKTWFVGEICYRSNKILRWTTLELAVALRWVLKLSDFYKFTSCFLRLHSHTNCFISYIMLWMKIILFLRANKFYWCFSSVGTVGRSVMLYILSRKIGHLILKYFCSLQTSRSWIFCLATKQITL